MAPTTKQSECDDCREEEHKIDMWEDCLSYLYEHVHKRLAIHAFRVREILIPDENFETSMTFILVSKHENRMSLKLVTSSSK